MNQTPNYALNQWEPGDQVLRADFNADNLKIDGSLKALLTRIATLEPLAADRSTSGTFEGDETAGRVLQLPWPPKLVFLLGKVNSDDKLFLLTPDCCISIGGLNAYIYTKDKSKYAPYINGSTVFFPCHWLNEGTTRYVAMR